MKHFAKCQACGAESRKTKARYQGGKGAKSGGAKFVGIFCPAHQPA